MTKFLNQEKELVRLNKRKTMNYELHFKQNNYQDQLNMFSPLIVNQNFEEDSQRQEPRNKSQETDQGRYQDSALPEYGSLKKPKIRNRSTGKSNQEKTKSMDRLQDYSQQLRTRANDNQRNIIQSFENDKFVDSLNLQNDNNLLIQELNSKLADLDLINQQKRQLNEDLLDMIKHVRETQSRLGTADNSKIQDVADKDLETQLTIQRKQSKLLKFQVLQQQVELQDIQNQLNVYQNEKEITILTRNGDQIQFQKVSMRLQDFITHYENVLKEIDQCGDQLSQLIGKPEIIMNENQRIQDNIQQLIVQRNDAQLRYLNLKEDFDRMFAQNRDRIRGINYELIDQNRHKLAQILQNSIGKVLRNRMQAYFDELIRRQMNERNQIKSILAFRRLCYLFEERRQVKYLQRWFQSALKPMDEKSHSYKATQFQTRNQLLKQFLIKWDQQRISCQFKQSRQRQKLKNFFQKQCNFGLRLQRYSFDIWKGQTDIWKNAVLRLKRFMVCQRLAKLERPIMRWKLMVFHQDRLIKLHAQSTKTSLLQFKQSIFCELRAHVIHRKLKRDKMKLRIFQALQKNKQQNRERRRKTLLLLKHQGSESNFLTQVCLHALAVNKEQSKLKWASDRLNNVELLRSMDASYFIEQAKKRAFRKASKRAILNGVIDPFSKTLKSYFDQWTFVTNQFKINVNTKLKDQIIRIYRSKLLEAWKRWAMKGQTKRRTRKIIMNTQIENQIIQKDTESANLKQRIKHEEVRQVNQRNKKFKQMLLKAYKSELSFRLNQWKSILQTNRVKAKALDNHILKGFRNRFIRLYFKRYQQQIKLQKRMQQKCLRADDLFAKFQFLQVRRIYTSWYALNKLQKSQNQKFKKILNVYSSKQQLQHFKKWQSYVEMKNKKKRSKKQLMMTQTVQQVSVSVGQTEDTKFQKEQNVVQQVRSAKQLGNVTIKKHVTLIYNKIYRKAFEKWKAQVIRQNQLKSSLGIPLFVRMRHNLQKDAFQCWRCQIQSQIKIQANDSIVHEKKLEQKQLERLQASTYQISQVRETSQSQLLELQQLKDAIKIKKFKVVEKLITDIFRNYSVPKQQQIFFAWRTIAHERAALMRKLVKNLQKNYAQKGFDSIWQFYNDLGRYNSTQRKLYKFYRGYERTRIRLGFSSWREHLFKKAKGQFAAFDEAEFHELENSNINRDRLLKKRVAMFWSCNQQSIIKIVFDELRYYAKNKIIQKHQFQKAKKSLISHKQKYAILNWKLNAHERLMLRVKYQRTTDLVGRLQTIRAFGALKQEYHKNKQFQSSFKVLVGMSHQGLLGQAFIEIQNYAKSNSSSKNKEKFLGARKMIVLMKMGENRKLKIWFDQFYENSKKKQIKELKLKHRFARVITKTQRDAFLNWKINCQFNALIEDMNESGPMRIEYQNAKALQDNLKLMLLEKRILSKEQVNRLLNKNQRKYRKSVEKTLCRMLVHTKKQQEDERPEWIKPWCIDKWKQYVKERKAYRYWLSQLNTLVVSKKNANQKQAFDRWRNSFLKLKNSLCKQTTEALEQRNYKNNWNMVRQANAIQQFQNETEELVNQREYLIDKVVAGQRLALARCNFSFKYARLKAFEKWRIATISGARGDFDEALNKALEAIQAAKQKIETFENENTDISEQNEGLREGAMEGVESLREVASMQQEVADLNQKLMKQAQQIRELLQTNKKLQAQVRKAEAEKGIPKKQ